MARFRLKDKHYLRVPGTEWEQKETDRATGKQARKVYPVPLYLDPDQPADQNYPDEIIVTLKPDPAFPRDIPFEGPPTFDMEPLDEEARAAIKKLGRRQLPFDELPMTMSESMLQKFESELSSGQPDSRVDALQAELAELKKQIAAIAKPSRRI